MPYTKKIVGQLSRLMNFATCGALLATVPINADMSSVLAQEIDLTTTPSVIAQYPIYRENNTRVLRAESGPDNRGRWRFSQPQDVSRDAMQGQGCTDVGGGGASWRCPRPMIRVQVNNQRPDYGRPDYGRPDYGRPDYGRNIRQLRAESGPDDRGRWRFSQPQDVSRDAMQDQGCTDVGGGGASWRCPRPMIRVQVNNQRPDYGRPDYGRPDYGRNIRQLRAESGPDNRGRWRFSQPQDVSRDAMQDQGCTDVGGGGASWRCPRPMIRVQVNNQRPDYGRPDYRRNIRQLRAESGPDNIGRWRFSQPQDVSRDAMQAQGCTIVGGGGASWRCPLPMIRVEVNRGR